MIVKPLEKVVASTVQHGTSRIARVIGTAGVDSTSFVHNARLISHPSTADRGEFLRLYTAYFIESSRTKKPNNILRKLYLKALEPIVVGIQHIIAKNAKVEVLKDSTGKVIGGFSYTIDNSGLSIAQMVLEPPKRNTKQGLSLLLQMAKRIKELAVESHVKVITCEVIDAEGHVSNLYKRAGFVKDPTVNIPWISRMGVSTEDFCKGNV